MFANNFLRRLTIPGVMGGLLLCQGSVRAQTTGVIQPVANDQVIQAWQQRNPGGAAATLERDGDGSTRLEWKLGNALDTYNNSVESASGALGSALRAGTFHRDVFSADVRLIDPGRSVDYLQAGVTHSDDPSVLSQSRHQVNQFVVGRAGPGFQLAAGDIAPNFSNLGSMLGARGLYGQRQVAGVTVSGYTGVVADSWEALANHVPRSQPIKDVQGIKLENSFATGLKTYLTAQSAAERAWPQLDYDVSGLPEGRSRSGSAGFQYQSGQLMLSGEMASSWFGDNFGAQRSGHAGIVDATWRTGSLGLRAGYHDLTAGFTSLSYAATPGVRETYAGADWNAASWAVLSADLRRSRATTLETEFSESTSTDTDSAAVRATFNFGPDLPGWSLGLQQAVSSSIDPWGWKSGNGDASLTLNYSAAQWTAALATGRGRVDNEYSPETDSRTDRWSLSIGRVFSDASPGLPTTWTLRTNLSAQSQRQRLLAGGMTRDSSYTLTIAGQRSGRGSFNLSLGGGALTQPLGGPSLRQSSLQFDATYALGPQIGLKVYVRQTRRNVGDELLYTRERVAGLQLTARF